MNLTLRAKLRLPEGCSNAELQAACSRYYAVYKGVLDSASEESVKAIARSKLEDLVSDAREEGITIQESVLYSFRSAEVNTPATVEEELSLLNGSSMISGSKAAELTGKIAALPDSAKRHYLSALVTLRSRDSSVETYRDVVSHLTNAARNDPENPVYPTMIADVDQEITRYLNALAAWRKKKKEELEKARRKELIMKILTTTGEVCLWLLGAAVTVAGAAFACICSAIEGC